MTSLRRAIIAWITILLGAVGILATVVAYELALSEAGEFMDDQLRQFANLTSAGKPVSDEIGALQEPEDRFAVVIWEGDGHVRNASADGPQIAAAPAWQGFSTFETRGESWRGYVKRSGNATLMVAQRMSARGELAQHAALGVAIPILATVPLAWLIVVITVGRVLRRLASLGQRIATHGVEARDPLSVEGLPVEIHPLVVAINVLIERQGSALEQQRRFIADSAHELRTPLAALRIQIDNLQSFESGESAAASAALRGGIRRAGDMVNQLLKLARFEGSTAREAPELLDASAVVTQCVADVVEIADAAGIDIGMTSMQPALVRAVRADLTLLVANLIDNAIRYTPSPGSVDCEVRIEEGDAVIVVRDTGPGAKKEDLNRLTDRFFRVAGNDTNGSGLGLSIVKAIADVHRWPLAIDNRKDRSGLTVEIRMPLATRQPIPVG